jgi:hypothetical protein
MGVDGLVNIKMSFSLSFLQHQLVLAPTLTASYITFLLSKVTDVIRVMS